MLVIGPNGETISSLGLERFNAISSVLGSLVAAVQIFADKFAGKDLSELQFGETRLFAHRVHAYFLVTLHSAADTAAEEVSRKVLSLVSDIPDGSLDEDTLTGISQLLDAKGHLSGKLHKSP